MLPLLIAAGAAGYLVLHHAPPRTPAQAVSYARSQLGKPYQWGAAGPDEFDCSGLVQQAYGWDDSLRTSEQQWAGLTHVSRPVKGDLVFFHGALMAGELPPGHVGIVVGSHEMIDAYAPGYGVEYDSFGTGTSKQGLQDVWGYASPLPTIMVTKSITRTVQSLHGNQTQHDPRLSSLPTESIRVTSHHPEIQRNPKT